MTKFNTNKTSNYGEEIDYDEVIDLLNNLIFEEGYGVLLDCIVPRIRNVDYPQGISKPIPFLKAVNVKEQLMIIMVEYKLYIPGAENDQELALVIDKSRFRFFKKENQINFLYGEDRLIELRLHNTFDFSYPLDFNSSIPTLSFIDWVNSPFI